MCHNRQTKLQRFPPLSRGFLVQSSRGGCHFHAITLVVDAVAGDNKDGVFPLRWRDDRVDDYDGDDIEDDVGGNDGR